MHKIEQFTHMLAIGNPIAHRYTKWNWKMLPLSTNANATHEETNRLNSRVIDFTYPTTLNNKSYCQSENDVKIFGLLANNSGNTISINFKQTKMHCNATQNEGQQYANHVKRCKQTSSAHQHYNTGPFTMSTHKMQLITILLTYLVVFSGIQTVAARPNIDHNYDDAESNWESVALTSENKVSRLFFPLKCNQPQN